MSGTISARPALRIALLSLATAILLAGAAVAALFGYLTIGRLTGSRQRQCPGRQKNGRSGHNRR